MSVSPPVASLSVFVAVARAGNFRRAAAVLSVTPGAISRRIRSLEARLGAALFERDDAGVRLNAAGRALFDDLGPAFDTIDTAWDNAHRRITATPPTRQTLSLSVPPSLAEYWLKPRLPALADADLAIEVEASQAFIVPNWAGDRIDLAIRYGAQAVAGVSCVPLMRDRLLPVVHAGHPLAGAHRLEEPTLVDALGRYPLYEVRWPARAPAPTQDARPGWRDFFAARAPGARSEGAVIERGRYDEALAAAARDQGVVLASQVIVADRLADETLVAPLGDTCSIATPFEFALVLPATGPAPTAIQRFIDRLVAIAAHTAAGD